MVDVVALKREIDKNGGVSSVAKRAGIKESTLYRKLASNGESFTIGEVWRLIGVLGFGFRKTTQIFLVKQSQV